MYGKAVLNCEPIRKLVAKFIFLFSGHVEDINIYFYKFSKNFTF